MKVRSLLLSMCAIAALASCSKNDDGIPGGGSDAPEAKVILKLVGNSDQATSKAAGLPSNDELAASNGTINNLMVFIFNSTGTVITKQYFDSPAGPNEVSTTTDAHDVAVIANAGQGLFTTVASKDALKAVLANMLAGDNPADAVTQKDNNIYMSGVGTLSAFTEQADKSMTATVTVPLNYLAARIQLKAISFNGGTEKGNKYVPFATFGTDETANFTIRRVYLMNVQRATHFLPANDSGTDYIAQGDKQYTGGVDWTEPWTTTMPNLFKKNNEYSIEAGSTVFQAALNTISDIGHWYTFANTGVGSIDNHPTALVVEVQWREVKKDDTAMPPVVDKIKTLYFTTYFGGGDKDELIPGNIYDVTLKLNGNFKPTNQGGSGGGGTTDPTKPTVNSSVEVTVTPADWALPLEISKEWK